MSNDIRTRGYKDVSFWNEEHIGLIVIRCDSHGNSRQSLAKELLEVVGIAYMDEEVKCIAFTGVNDNFLNEIMLEERRGAAREFFDYLHTLVRTIYSIRKPIFSVINGSAINIGYELALLSDISIASRGVPVGFTPGYTFVSLGSLTSLRYGVRGIEKAEAGRNVDIVLEKDNFLDDAKKTILSLSDQRYDMTRKAKLRGYEDTLFYEKDEYMRVRMGLIDKNYDTNKDSNKR